MTIEEKENSILSLYADKEDIFDGCSNLIFNEVWSNDLNAWRYRIIKGLFEKGKKPDSLIVQNFLLKKGFNRKEIALALTSVNFKMLNNVNEYVKDIFNDYCRRILAPKLLYCYKDLESEISDVEADMEDLKATINDLESIRNNLSKDKSIKEIYKEAFEDLMKAQESKQEVIGYSWGLKDLDDITSGAKQEVILCIGPPAMGKTSLMVNSIKHIGLKQKKPMVIFSLEVSAKKLMTNIWANSLEINSKGIRNGHLSDESLLKIKHFENMLGENIVIDDTPGITWQYMEAKIVRVRKKLQIPLSVTMVVMIDYVQIMRNTPDETKGCNEEQQQSLRANGLLEMSKRQNVCLVEFSQMGREAIKQKKEPTMQDAKGSGAWESNSDQTWGLFRPEYFDKEAMEDGISLKGLGKIIVLKNRYGELGSVLVKFKGHFSAFEDYTPPQDAF